MFSGVACRVQFSPRSLAYPPLPSLSLKTDTNPDTNPNTNLDTNPYSNPNKNPNTNPYTNPNTKGWLVASGYPVQR